MSTVIIFAGHRIDTSDRHAPRFPVARAPAAARAIASALPEEAQVGVSSAANGGDILFLEACAAQGIPCHIILPFPLKEFLERSVTTDATGDWEIRFHQAWSTTPEANRHILTLRDNLNAFAACNDALLTLASKLGNPQVIALWDRQVNCDAGGTSDLIGKAHSRGWPVRIIDP